jgi:orotate phosphoribosyltransferase
VISCYLPLGLILLVIIIINFMHKQGQSHLLFCDSEKTFDSFQPLKYNYATMNEQERLIQIIKERSFQYSKEPVYRLTSGAVSNFYFNMKKTASSGEALYLTGKLVFEKIREQQLQIDAIGGLTMGADPIAYAVARYSYDVQQPIEAFVIRKEAKGHGLHLQVEGNVKPGDRVVIVDDVVTTGGSTIKAIGIAREYGLAVVAAIVLVDRYEQNGRENIESLGLPVYDILTIEDFIPFSQK